MKLKKIFASAVVAVAAITSVASLTSCKKDDVTDGGGNETDLQAEIQEKLNAAINALSVKSTVEVDFTLQTTAAGGVTISWASDNVDVIKIENGKAIVTRPGLTEEDATVKLTATAVIDGETKVKEFTIIVPHIADESKTIAAIKELADGTKTAAKGIVTGFAYNDTKDITVRSGFYLTDATDTIYVFGKNVAAELSIGDEIYLSAEKDIYYGAHQLSYPSDVVELGTGKTATFANVITDKTITDLATAPKPGDNETTNQGKVYELLAYFEKSGTETYVNYRVVDPYNTSNYLNVYFSSTILPDKTYEFTEEYAKYVGKYCKVKFYMCGTNSSGKWRGHILDFEDLSEAESAKMLLVQATDEILPSMTVPASGTEIELPEITLPTGATLNVTSDSEYVTYADSKLCFTRPTENKTANVKFEIKLGEVVVAEYTKTITIIVEPVDITSKVTVEDGVISIPYGAITSDGEFYITLETGKVVTIIWNKFTDTPSYSEFGVAENGSFAITATGGIKFDAIITDVFGSYDNMKCYVGADNTGTVVTGTIGTGNGTTHTYAFETAPVDKIYLENTNADHGVDFYSLQLVLEGSLNELKAKEEANRLAGLISSLYEDTTEIDLSSQVGTVVITPQAGATTLAANGTTLTVTPGATEVTETFTITVTIGDAEYTTNAINVKSKKFVITTGDFKATLEYTDGVTVNMSSTANNADLLNLKSALFYVSSNTCGSYNNTIGLNKNGSLRLYSNSDGNGNILKISGNAQDYTVIFNKIKITYSDQVNAFTVNGTTGSKDVAEYEINGPSIIIKNTAESGQVRISKIEIDYSVHEKTDGERAQEEKLRLQKLIDSVYDKATEIDLSSEYGTVEVIPQDGAKTISFTNNILTITPFTEDVTETFDIKVTVGQSFTITVPSIEITVLAAPIPYTDITSNVTIANGIVTIPYDAIEADGYYSITVDTDKVIKFQYTGFADKSTDNRIGLTAGNFIKFMAEGVKLEGLNTDVKGTYDNMSCYIGKDATGTIVTPQSTTGTNGKAYTYYFENEADAVYFANLSNYDVEFYGFELVLEDSYDYVKARIEANRLAGLISSYYGEETEVNLASTVGTVEVTPQTNATTLVFANNKLTVTPGATEVTETLTITVTVGEKTYTTEAISVTSVVEGTKVEFETSYFPGSYTADETTLNVAGYTWGYKDVAVYSNGIQLKKNTGSIYNKTALTGKITKLIFEWNSEKTTYDNENYLKIELGTDNTYSGQTVYLSTVAGQKSYSLDITGEYTYIRMTNVLTNVQYWDVIKVVYDGTELTDIQIAENEANRILDLIDTTITYDAITNITLKASVGTLTVTPQAQATTLAFTNNKLTITPTQVQTEETLTISVKVGDETYTTDEIIISSLLAQVEVQVGEYSEILASDGSQDYVASDSTSDYAATLGLSSLFSVTFAANSCTNGSGIARFHTTNYLQMYGASDSNGTSLTVSINQPTGYVVTITSVSITFTSVNSVKLNGNELTVENNASTATLNSTTGFTLQNTHTSQMKVKEIVINYTIAQANE